VQPHTAPDWAASHPKIPGRAVGGPGVQVTACGGDRSVAEGLLHEVDGRTPVEAAARMGGARAHFSREPSSIDHPLKLNCCAGPE
jgi:hypothetical protein